jgi:hypothetical protein
MSHRVFRVIRLEHAEYVLEGICLGNLAGSKPSGTYSRGMSESLEERSSNDLHAIRFFCQEFNDTLPVL